MLQGTILGPILFFIISIITADLREAIEIMTATYTDDTAILSWHKNPNMATRILLTHLHPFEQWLLNKSAHITFSMRIRIYPVITLNGSQIPQADTVKYLDRKWIWRRHIFVKPNQLGTKLGQLHSCEKLEWKKCR